MNEPIQQQSKPTSAEKVPRPTLWQVYVSFVRMGAVLIGGGNALLPLLDDEVVKRRGWATEEEMADYYALAQLLPGVIAINASMLIGNHLRGFAGNLISSLGLVTVPFFLIALYAITYSNINSFPLVMATLEGMRPAVAGMILGFGINMLIKALKPFFKRKSAAGASPKEGK